MNTTIFDRKYLRIIEGDEVADAREAVEKMMLGLKMPDGVFIKSFAKDEAFRKTMINAANLIGTYAFKFTTPNMYDLFKVSNPTITTWYDLLKLFKVKLTDKLDDKTIPEDVKKYIESVIKIDALIEKKVIEDILDGWKNPNRPKEDKKPAEDEAKQPVEDAKPTDEPKPAEEAKPKAKDEVKVLRNKAMAGAKSIIGNMGVKDIKTFFKDYLIDGENNENDLPLMQKMIVAVIRSRLITMTTDELKEFLTDNGIKLEESVDKRYISRLTAKSLVKLLKGK